jgi:myosin heavy subunit
MTDMVDAIADKLLEDHVSLMNECESLRQQLAVLQINNTKFLEINLENEQLKQQLHVAQVEVSSMKDHVREVVADLVECMNGRDSYKEAHEKMYDLMCKRTDELVECERERDELHDALKNVAEKTRYAAGLLPCQQMAHTCESAYRIAQATLAKVGAGKTGEDYSDCHGPDWTERDGEYLK